jgi:hypothetical protein
MSNIQNEKQEYQTTTSPTYSVFLRIDIVYDESETASDRRMLEHF